MTEQDERPVGWSRRRSVVILWCGWLLVGGSLTYLVVDMATQGWGTDASTGGVYRALDDECSDHVEYVVDGRAYLLDLDDRRTRRCLRPDGGATAPQRVFYETSDPTNAVLTDPGGPGPMRVVGFVGAAAIGLTTVLVPVVAAVRRPRRR